MIKEIKIASKSEKDLILKPLDRGKVEISYKEKFSQELPYLIDEFDILELLRILQLLVVKGKE